MSMRSRFSIPNQRGFTLPELLIAGGIIVVIALTGLKLVSSTSQVTTIKDAERRTDVAWMAQALNRYRVATGHLPAGIPAKAQYIGSDNGEFNMCSVMVPTYLGDIPMDPDNGLRYKGTLASTTADNCTTKNVHYYSGYTIVQNANGSVTLAAPAGKVDHVSIVVQ